jgi:hypothetical protein
MTPHDLYYSSTTTREAAERLYEELLLDITILGNRIKALPDDAVTSCPAKIRECWGIWMGIRRQAVRKAEKMGIPAARPFFAVYVFGTPRWEKLTRLHTELYHRSRQYKTWRKGYEATPERRLSEATRKRMSYYGVDDPALLPPRSPRGRKPSIPKSPDV